MIDSLNKIVKIKYIAIQIRMSALTHGVAATEFFQIKMLYTDMSHSHILKQKQTAVSSTYECYSTSELFHLGDISGCV